MNDYRTGDYTWIRELLDYPRTLEERLLFFEDTASIVIPADPIERVIFQDRAKMAIRKIAQNRGHMLMVGRPGTGKSMLAEMFKEVLDRSVGDILRPQEVIVAFPGKDRNHVRVAYENPEKLDRVMEALRAALEAAQNSSEEFSLEPEIRSVRRLRWGLVAAAACSGAAGLLFPPLLLAAGLTGMGAIFMLMQETTYRAQEKIQRESGPGGCATTSSTCTI